ncbi:hypothetical protein FHL15_002602 [Xylaria flabelliformis]|uniref:Uncharacterized protein n=1 Tax=Xylaria flabelliformis TaxID=2512241 RepID=A0A553I7Z7_9PEZI|nr:hypothetical protein FHL15_002602 [Xylaria flabelliformis]
MRQPGLSVSQMTRQQIGIAQATPRAAINEAGVAETDGWAMGSDNRACLGSRTSRDWKQKFGSTLLTEPGMLAAAWPVRVVGVVLLHPYCTSSARVRSALYSQRRRTAARRRHKPDHDAEADDDEDLWRPSNRLAINRIGTT